MPTRGGQGEYPYFLALASKWCVLVHFEGCFEKLFPLKLGDSNKHVTMSACNNFGTTLEVSALKCLLYCAKW